jgi:hypothetical protein
VRSDLDDGESGDAPERLEVVILCHHGQPVGRCHSGDPKVVGADAASGLGLARPKTITVTTGTMRVNPDRPPVSLPKVGQVATCVNTRWLERLIALGRARILAVIQIRAEGCRGR